MEIRSSRQKNDRTNHKSPSITVVGIARTKSWRSWEHLSSSLGTTTMSNPGLPQETIDYIIDILRYDPKALKACCLISKPWIPRAQKYLFADIRFDSVDDL